MCLTQESGMNNDSLLHDYSSLLTASFIETKETVPSSKEEISKEEDVCDGTEYHKKPLLPTELFANVLMPGQSSRSRQDSNNFSRTGRNTLLNSISMSAKL